MNRSKLRLYMHISLFIYALVYGFLILLTDCITSGWSLAFVLSFATIGILSDILGTKNPNKTDNKESEEERS